PPRRSPLSLHDALPIWTIGLAALAVCVLAFGAAGCARKSAPGPLPPDQSAQVARVWPPGRSTPLKITDTLTLSIPLEYERSALRSEEHTSELQSLAYLV